VSSGKKKRPSGSTSRYREPTKTSQPARRGLLDGLFAPRPPGGSPMPKLRRTLARGTVTTLSIPWLVAAVPLVVFVLWVLVTLGGYEGPFKAMGFTFAIPPITTIADRGIYQQALRPAVDASGVALALPSLVSLFGAIALHALLQATVATLSVEKLRTGSVSTWALRRMPRVWVVCLMIGVICLGLFIAGQFLPFVLGQIGALLFLAIIAAGVYLLGFAPAIMADEERGPVEALARSSRAARMPGSANLWLAVGYLFLSLVLLFGPLPGSDISVTPSVSAWVVVIVANLVSLIMQSTLAYRYLAVAAEVPEGPPVRQQAGRR
jgi:hypothetical protein